MPADTPRPRCKRCATIRRSMRTSTTNMPTKESAMSEISHLKPPVPPSHFEYKQLKQGEFWRHVPAYREVDETTFLDHLWQQKNAVKTPQELLTTIKDLVSPEFFADVEEGFAQAPMAVRVSPYALALIDWTDPVNDPIRRQFVPLASALLPDHPRLTLDSL